LITAAEIKKQAEKAYEAFLIAFLKGDLFFPKEIHFGKIRPGETLEKYSHITESIKRLKEHSKEAAGYGFTIQYSEVNNRKIGKQFFPKKILFENEADYLRFIDKEKEFTKFKENVSIIIDGLPVLKDWVINNPMKVIDHSSKWQDLVAVCQYFVGNPKPMIYIRELPIEVHTKFVEENKGILKSLLDFLIEPYINKTESDFEKRFNLKYYEPFIRMRILDSDLARHLYSGIADLVIPQSEFYKAHIRCKLVLVMENKTNFSNAMNFLTLPELKESMAVFGNGYQIELLGNAQWLSDKHIIYWGDIDAHGFHILSILRSYFPQTKSLMMDFETFDHFRNFRVLGPVLTFNSLPHLTNEESNLFQYLLSLKDGNRLEQERITHKFALNKIRQLLGQ
jgi:hypothetical protein